MGLNDAGERLGERALGERHLLEAVAVLGGDAHQLGEPSVAGHADGVPREAMVLALGHAKMTLLASDRRVDHDPIALLDAELIDFGFRHLHGDAFSGDELDGELDLSADPDRIDVGLRISLGSAAFLLLLAALNSLRIRLIRHATLRVSIGGRGWSVGRSSISGAPAN